MSLARKMARIPRRRSPTTIGTAIIQAAMTVGQPARKNTEWCTNNPTKQGVQPGAARILTARTL